MGFEFRNRFDRTFFTAVNIVENPTREPHKKWKVNQIEEIFCKEFRELDAMWENENAFHRNKMKSCFSNKNLMFEVLKEKKISSFFHLAKSGTDVNEPKNAILAFKGAFQSKNWYCFMKLTNVKFLLAKQFLRMITSVPFPFFHLITISPKPLQ